MIFVKYGLSLARLKGKSYDGASNMNDAFNDLKMLILNENKNAHYIHGFDSNYTINKAIIIILGNRTACCAD